MTTEAGKKIIDSEWTSSGIKDAISLGLHALPSIDPYNDIAPMMVEANENPILHNPAVCNLTPEFKSIGYSRDDESSDEEVWGPEGDGNIFDRFAQFNGGLYVMQPRSPGFCTFFKLVRKRDRKKWNKPWERGCM